MDGHAYLDSARPGAENMDIDRRLLEIAERRQCAFVRVYRWNEATLSLGHFQSHIDRNEHPPSSRLPSVLRASGGGAIVHHHEWTYSVAIPVGKNKIGAATEIYDLVHDSLVEGLNKCGWVVSKWSKACDANPSNLAAEVVGCAAQTNPTTKSPFLCFQRRSCGDLVCGDYKVVGSAQRRLGTSVLQHGSILCARSPYAPELPGLADLPRLPDNKLAQSPIVPETDPDVLNSLLGMENFGQIVLCWISQAVFGHMQIKPVSLAGSDAVMSMLASADT